MALSERPTADLILLILTLLITASVLLTGAGVFVIAVVRPDVDAATVLSSFAEMISLLIGVIVGYIAGRGRSAQSGERG